MTVNIRKWYELVRDEVSWLADEKTLRQTWNGKGKYVGGPDETFCHFFSDAAIEEYLDRDDTGLNQRQIEALGRLTRMMRKLSDETPDSIDREIGPSFIDDPRWQEIINAAQETLSLLPVKLDTIEK